MAKLLGCFAIFTVGVAIGGGMVWSEAFEHGRRFERERASFSSLGQYVRDENGKIDFEYYDARKLRQIFCGKGHNIGGEHE